MNDPLRVLQRQPRRISITLSYHVHEALLSRSENEGRSVSNLCAFLLEDALLRDQQQVIHTGSGDGDGARTLHGKRLLSNNGAGSTHLRRF